MAKIDPVAILTCDATVLDPHGKVTLYGLFDLIWAQTFPARHPQLAIYVKARFAEPTTAQVVVLKPDGMPLVSFQPLEVKQAGNAQAIYNLQQVEFPTEGVYQIALMTAQGSAGFGTLEVRVRQ